MFWLWQIQSDGKFPVIQNIWEMWSTTPLPPLPGPLWHGVVAADMGLIELNCALMINWIPWNRTVLILKLRTYELLEIQLFWYINCVLMLNWIVWNITVFDIETVLTLNWIVWIRTVWQNWIAWNRTIFDKQNVYLY